VWSGTFLESTSNPAEKRAHGLIGNIGKTVHARMVPVLLGDGDIFAGMIARQQQDECGEKECGVLHHRHLGRDARAGGV
jgi:hypothetical protein